MKRIFRCEEIHISREDVERMKTKNNEPSSVTLDVYTIVISLLAGIGMLALTLMEAFALR